MKDNGVDMSRVSISRSYAVLVGLEAYVKTRRKFKHGVGHVKEAETRVVHPEEHKRLKEEQKDKSESAEKERQLLAQKAENEEKAKKEQSWRRKVWKRISGGGSEKDDASREQAKEHKRKMRLSRSGLDVEDGIAPTGTRDRLGKHEP